MKDKILIDGKVYVDYKDARKLILKQVEKIIDGCDFDDPTFGIIPNSRMIFIKELKQKLKEIK